MAVTEIKKDIRQLLDKLPERELHAAKRFMQYLVALSEKEDPVLKAMENAPLDDEPLTKEDVKALDKAYRDIKEGRILSDKEFRRRVLES